MKEENKSNHYQDLIERTKAALKEENLEELKLSLKELNEELNLPYIPAKFEEKIYELHKEVSTIILSKQISENGDYDDVLMNKRPMSEKLVKKQLLSPISEELVQIAINSLEGYNINLFDKEIRTFLKEEKNDFSMQQTLLLQTLADQKAYGEYIVVKNRTVHKVVIADTFTIYETKLLDTMKEIDESKKYDDQVKDLAMNMATLHWLDEYPATTNFDETEIIAGILLETAKKNFEAEGGIEWVSKASKEN